MKTMSTQAIMRNNLFSFNKTKLVSLLVFAFVSLLVYNNMTVAESIAYRYNTNSNVFVQQWTADSTWAGLTWNRDSSYVR